MSWKAFLTPEWLWRHTVALGIIAQLWLNSNYVLRTEYTADRKDTAVVFARINETLSDVRLALELLKASNTQLGDHEARLRSLEKQR
jgi:hypothetical protein